jgi:hypothetical protein
MYFSENAKRWDIRRGWIRSIFYGFPWMDFHVESSKTPMERNGAIPPHNRQTHIHPIIRQRVCGMIHARNSSTVLKPFDCRTLNKESIYRSNLKYHFNVLK